MLKVNVQNCIKAVRYHRMGIMAAVIMAALYLGMMCFCDEYVRTDTVEEPSPLLKAAYSMLDSIVDRDMLVEVSDRVNIIYSQGASNLTIAGHTLGNVSVLTDLGNIMAAIAVLICSGTLFIGFINLKEQDIAGEEVFKRLIIWGICVAVCLEARNICFFIANIGSALADVAVSHTGFDSVQLENTVSALKRKMWEDARVWSGDGGLIDRMLTNIGSFFSPLPYIFELLIPWLAMHITKIMVNIVLWGRALEVLVMATFSPIAFCDATDIVRFGQGAGSRFVKTMCALALQGAIIVVLMSLCSQIAVDILIHTLSGDGSYGTMFLDYVFIGLAEAGLVFKSGSIAKSLLGVG